MLEITVPLICELNKCVLRPGENFNVLDNNRLESAIGNQWAPYPQDEQAIASVYRAIIQNHPFENGNKRTAVLIMLKMTESINKKMVLNHQELIDLTLKLANEGGGRVSTNSIANKLFGLKLEEKFLKEKKYEPLKSNGIYSVKYDEWIKEPVQEDIPEVDREAFDKLFNEWEGRYFNIIGSETIPEDDKELIESQSIKRLYHYRGPVYRFNRFVKNVDLETLAVSYKQAVNNFKFKAARAIGYNRASGANVEIRDDLVTVEDYTQEEDELSFDEVEARIHQTCPKCGTILNDAGQCPLCDLGDESVLDESYETDLQYKIDDIDDFIEDIYDLRKESLANEGEYGIGNLVFKELRNKGYLDNLKDIKNKLKSKKLSLL